MPAAKQMPELLLAIKLATITAEDAFYAAQPTTPPLGLDPVTWDSQPGIHGGITSQARKLIQISLMVKPCAARRLATWRNTV